MIDILLGLCIGFGLMKVYLIAKESTANEDDVYRITGYLFLVAVCTFLVA